MHDILLTVGLRMSDRNLADYAEGFGLLGEDGQPDMARVVAHLREGVRVDVDRGPIGDYARVTVRSAAPAQAKKPSKEFRLIYRVGGSLEGDRISYFGSQGALLKKVGETEHIRTARAQRYRNGDWRTFWSYPKARTS